MDKTSCFMVDTSAASRFRRRRRRSSSSSSSNDGCGLMPGKAGAAQQAYLCR
jgi:hypothetical protein